MARRLGTRLRRGEEGMTLIELLVAAVLVAVGVLALFSVLDGSRHLVTTSEKNDVAAHQGEAEIERILALDYSAIALTTAPAHAAASTDPDLYSPASRPDQGAQDAPPKPADPMVVDPTAGTLTHISTWSDGQNRL